MRRSVSSIQSCFTAIAEDPDSCGYACNTFIDRDGRKLAHALLAALGKPTTGVAQWQLHWKRCYQAQTDLLLSVQARHITRQWALTHIHCRSPLPTDGAILVSIHHSGSLRGMVALSARLHPIGVITDNPRFSDTVSVMDSTMRRQLRATEAMRELVYGERIFKIRHAGRSGLKLLRNCGYLVIFADSFWDDAPMHPLLGRSLSIPRGAVWFAQHSGKPIVPFMVVPSGLGWRLWVGEAIAPLPEAMVTAIEKCVRMAPESWKSSQAIAWLQAPLSPVS